MIRIIPKGTAIDPETLIGKIVMRDAGLIWEALKGAVEVTSRSGSKLMGYAVPTIFDEATGQYVLHANAPPRRERDEEPFMLASVRAICDTPEEVLLIRNRGLLEDVAFRAMKQKASENLQALHGMSVPRPQDELGGPGGP